MTDQLGGIGDWLQAFVVCGTIFFAVATLYLLLRLGELVKRSADKGPR